MRTVALLLPELRFCTNVLISRMLVAMTRIYSSRASSLVLFQLTFWLVWSTFRLIEAAVCRKSSRSVSSGRT